MSGDTVVEDYSAFRETAGAVWLERDFVTVSGPDSVKFLQGQLSQDVNLAVGASAYSLLLSPQGKVVVLLRFTRLGDEEFLLDVDGGCAEATIERLNRFMLRTKCSIEQRSWRCLAVRGPSAHQAAGEPGAALALPADWPGLPGVDLVGEGPVRPPDVRACSHEAYEIVRIEAGVPVAGRELDERTIPAEAGLVERSVSFTKGCYTGQELVARIDSRGGNVARHLRGLVLEPDIGTDPTGPATAETMVGASISVDGKEVGRITSAAGGVGGLPVVALGFVHRSVEPPAGAEAAWPGGTAAVRVEALPLRP